MINLIIATLCFSLSFGMIKSQLSTLPTDWVVMLRLVFATLIFVPFIRKLNWRVHARAFLIGIIQFGVMYFAFLRAFKYLQGNEVALLTTTTPVFVAIWASLFGDRFRFIYILCILMSVCGAGIVVWQNLEFSQIVYGVLLMEISNCTFALGQVLWQKFIPCNVRSENLMASAYLGALAMILPFVIAHGDFSLATLTPPQWMAILYLGIVPTGIGFYLWNRGARRVSSWTLAIMNNLKIPFGVLCSILVFHEHINPVNFIIGTSVIMMAILILQFQHHK